jgi:hypothetical protein
MELVRCPRAGFVTPRSGGAETRPPGTMTRAQELAAAGANAGGERGTAAGKTP